MEITHKYFEPFNIYCYENNKYTFFHISIKNKDFFYSNLFDYFFDENKLVQYIENQKGIHFDPSKKQYVTLYKHLKNYIDIENIEITINNMSVYGIDTLFYSSEDNLLLFGESKFCIKLQNGINLVNESLKNYEHQISEDFRLILSGGFKNQCNQVFNEKFGTIRDESLTMKDFIEKANIENIGIPIFIAHGTEIDEEVILKKLNSIKKYSFFGINTAYFYISLPIINKEELIKVFTEKINNKLEYYSSEARK